MPTVQSNRLKKV